MKKHDDECLCLTCHKKLAAEHNKSLSLWVKLDAIAQAVRQSVRDNFWYGR